MCLARGGVGGEGGEWMRGLGLGFTNPVGTRGVLDVCLCFGCGGVGGELFCPWNPAIIQGVNLDFSCGINTHSLLSFRGSVS